MPVASDRDHEMAREWMRTYDGGHETRVSAALAAAEAARVAAEVSREKMSQHLADKQHEYVKTALECDRAVKEVERLRTANNTLGFELSECRVKNALCADENARMRDAVMANQRALDALGLVPAPSPSARAGEPVAWRVMRGIAMTWAARTKQEADRMSAFIPGSRVEPLFRAPPDLTAEIARLMMEKERRQHIIEADKAEIAKLKAELEKQREATNEWAEDSERLRAQLDGTRREKITTGWLVRIDPEGLWAYGTEEAARDFAKRARVFNSAVRVVRLTKPKPAAKP